MIFSLYFLEHKYSYLVVRYPFILHNYNMNLSAMYKKNVLYLNGGRFSVSQIQILSNPVERDGVGWPNHASVELVEEVCLVAATDTCGEQSGVQVVFVF